MRSIATYSKWGIVLLLLLFSLIINVACSGSRVGDEYDVIYKFSGEVIEIDVINSRITLMLEKNDYADIYAEETIICSLKETFYKDADQYIDMDKLYVGAYITFGVFKSHPYDIYVIYEIENRNGDYNEK